MKKHYFSIAFLLFFIFSCDKSVENKNTSTISAFDYEIVKEKTSDSAAVVSAHPLASEIGKQILKEGGNAIDASIAVQYALAVVYPGAGNLGGGGFMLIHTSDGKNNSIDFRETAAGKADENMYLDENGDRKSVV